MQRLSKEPRTVYRLDEQIGLGVFHRWSVSLTHQLAALGGRQRIEGIIGGSEESERPLLVQQLCHSCCLDGADQEAESRRGYV